MLQQALRTVRTERGRLVPRVAQAGAQTFPGGLAPNQADFGLGEAAASFLGRFLEQWLYL